MIVRDIQGTVSQIHWINILQVRSRIHLSEVREMLIQTALIPEMLTIKN